MSCADLAVILLSLHCAYRAWRYPKDAIQLQSGFPLAILHSLLPGMRVKHVLQGPGIVVDVLSLSNKQPYKVLFDNGNTICFSLNAACKRLREPKPDRPVTEGPPAYTYRRVCSIEYLMRSTPCRFDHRTGSKKQHGNQFSERICRERQEGRGDGCGADRQQRCR